MPSPSPPLPQVLQLEEGLSDADASRQQLTAQVSALQVERDRARFEAAQAKQWARAAETAARAQVSRGGGRE